MTSEKKFIEEALWHICSTKFNYPKDIEISDLGLYFLQNGKVLFCCETSFGKAFGFAEQNEYSMPEVHSNFGSVAFQDKMFTEIGGENWFYTDLIEAMMPAPA